MFVEELAVLIGPSSRAYTINREECVESRKLRRPSPQQGFVTYCSEECDICNGNPIWYSVTRHIDGGYGETDHSFYSYAQAEEWVKDNG